MQPGWQPITCFFTCKCFVFNDFAFIVQFQHMRTLQRNHFSVFVIFEHIFEKNETGYVQMKQVK